MEVKEEVNKPLNNIGYSAGNTVDQDIIAAANTFLGHACQRQEYSGISSKLSILRTFFLNKLNEENQRLMHAEQAKAS